MQFIECTTEEEVLKVIRYCPKVVAIDCETNSKEARTAILDCFVIANTSVAYKIPAKFIKHLETLKDPRRTFVFQNWKYDVMILQRHGVDLFDQQIRDTMLMHHLIDENAEHGLGAMCQKYFNDAYKEEFWSKYKTFQDAPKEEQLSYVCKDGIYTAKLHAVFSDKLFARKDLVDHVHRLSKALYQTEKRGVDVDLPLMARTKEDMGSQIQGYLPKLREEFLPHCQSYELMKWRKQLEAYKTEKGRLNARKPEPFNFGSDAQVQWLLYDALGLPVVTKTKKGNPSTDYDTIKQLNAETGRLDTLLAYKDIKNIYATFVEGMIKRVYENKIYPEFNINGTHTGRISHSNPNMGNMPKVGPIRNFFLPPHGMCIIGADYIQLEVVIEGNITADTQLQRILLEGISKHDITADSLGISRDAAKTLNFALQYWCSPDKVSKLLGVSKDEGRAIYDRYWGIYSGVRDTKLKCDQEVLANWSVTNLFGRTRHFERTTNFWQLEKIKRQAYNFKVQGPGGDIMNRAFYLMVERLNKNGHGVGLWTVHDEGLFAVYPQYVEDEKKVLVDIMVGVGNELGFKLPLSAKAYGPLERWAKT